MHYNGVLKQRRISYDTFITVEQYYFNIINF